MSNEFRGSRKHVLDLLSSGHAGQKLTQLFTDINVVVQDTHRLRPVNNAEPGEWDLRRFCRECAPEGVDLRRLNEWWVSEEYTGPTWDLLAECSISGRPGFLIVEAKAHESELHREGKTQLQDASAQSKLNHERIGKSLERTQEWFLANLDPKCRIDVHSHYQLANRLSAAEALAACGGPVVLLYLGFTGDTYFASDYLRDEGHWQRVMGAYLDGVVPLSWPGTTTPHTSGGSVTMLIRALPVQQISSRQV